jgi:hypothetical protein
MTPELWQRVSAALDHVATLTADQVEDYLDQLADGDRPPRRGAAAAPGGSPGDGALGGARGGPLLRDAVPVPGPAGSA